MQLTVLTTARICCFISLACMKCVLQVHLGFHWAMLVRLMLSPVSWTNGDTSLFFAGGWFLQKSHFIWWFYWLLQWTSIDQETSVGYFKNTTYGRYNCICVSFPYIVAYIYMHTRHIKETGKPLACMERLDNPSLLGKSSYYLLSILMCFYLPV